MSEKTIKNEPLISVIICCYNSAECLERCLKAIENQSYKNLEIILVNDGSTDGTAEIIEKYAKNVNFKVVTTENKGVASARNVGLM